MRTARGIYARTLALMEIEVVFGAIAVALYARW